MGTAGHHGTNHLVHIQNAVNDTAPSALQSLVHGLFHLCQICDPEALQSVGLGQPDKVGTPV